MSNKEIEISVEIKFETDLAYRVFDGARTEWVPKRFISDYCEEDGRIISIFLPEWLALEKGFI